MVRFLAFALLFVITVIVAMTDDCGSRSKIDDYDKTQKYHLLKIPNSEIPVVV